MDHGAAAVMAGVYPFAGSGLGVLVAGRRLGGGFGPVDIEIIPPKNPKRALKNRKKIAILPVEVTLF